jgi:hypothetical protein
MRIAWSFVILIATLAVGCERESGSGAGGPAPVPASAPAPATRRALPTSDEVFGSSRLTTRPATTQADAAPALEPLETPDATVTRLFELMQKQDVAGVRAMLADPLPVERLRTEVAAVADRMNSGAKWSIVESRVEGAAAVVLFRTTFPDGKEELTGIFLLNRYDRWRAMLGTMNVRRLTSGEKESINKVGKWAAGRLDELRGVSTTTQATSAPAGSDG